MNIKKAVSHGLSLVALSCLAPLALSETHPVAINVAQQVSTLQDSYDRLLPLEGGSNFRDLGGYKTEDNKYVKRGMLFRSGAMTTLSETDQAYLQRFGFQSVLDLRSDEELELFPNQWAKNAELDYLRHDYSFRNLAANFSQSSGEIPSMEVFYTAFPQFLKPQLKIYFDSLLNRDVPMVVNCSAGQDRTGFASAMVLSALGVPRDTVIRDYLLSTEFRRPKNEFGDVNLEEAAKTNSFAAMMMQYKDKAGDEPGPLYTEDGTPFIVFALNAIDDQYGGVENYLASEIGVDKKDLKKLRKYYLEK